MTKQQAIQQFILIKGLYSVLNKKFPPKEYQKFDYANTYTGHVRHNHFFFYQGHSTVKGQIEWRFVVTDFHYYNDPKVSKLFMQICTILRKKGVKISHDHLYQKRPSIGTYLGMKNVKKSCKHFKLLFHEYELQQVSD